MPHDISTLAVKVQTVHQAISDLAREDIGGRLGPIIHRPGWTTIAEFALVDASLESLRRHIEAAQAHCRQLIEAAGKVREHVTHQAETASIPTGKIDITKLSQLSVRRFTFFMKFVAESNLWDEAELYLDDHGCVEILVSREPIAAIPTLLQDKILAGESISHRGRRIVLSATCGGGHPSPPPKFPPGPGGGGDGGPPPGPPPDGGRPE